MRPTKVMDETVFALEILQGKKSRPGCRPVLGKDRTGSVCNSSSSGCWGRDVGEVGVGGSIDAEGSAILEALKGVINGDPAI